MSNASSEKTRTKNFGAYLPPGIAKLKQAIEHSFKLAALLIIVVGDRIETREDITFAL